MLSTRRGSGRRPPCPARPPGVTPSVADGQRDRCVGPLGRAALGAPGQRPRPPRTWARNSAGVAAWRRFGPGAPDVHAGVVVAAADADAVAGGDVGRGGAVELGRAGAVANLPDAEQLGQPPAMAGRQRRCDGVVGVRQGAGDLTLVEVCRAQLDVAAVRLQPVVIIGRDAVAEHVHGLGLAPEARRSAPPETNTSGRSAIRCTPAIVSWSVIVTKSIPRRLASS